MTISDLSNFLKEKMQIRSPYINLSLDDAILPLDEDIKIVRDGDEIRIRSIHNENTQNSNEVFKETIIENLDTKFLALSNLINQHFKELEPMTKLNESENKISKNDKLNVKSNKMKRLKNNVAESLLSINIEKNSALTVDDNIFNKVSNESLHSKNKISTPDNNLISILNKQIKDKIKFMKKNKEIIKKDNEFISAKIINNEIPIQNNSMTINSSIQSINNKMEEDNISYTYLDTSNRISTARSKKTRIDKKWRNKKKRDCNANIENIPNNKHIIFSDSDSETNESNLMQSMKIKNHVMISKPEFLKIDGNNVDTKKIDYKVIKELKNETSTNLLQKIANKEICHHRDQGFNKYRKQSHRDNPLKAYQKNESFVFKNIDVDKLPDIPITELDFECYEIILKDSEIDPKNNQDLTSNILQTTKKPNIVSKLPIIVDLDSPIIDPITEVPNIQKTPRLFDNSFNSQKNKTIYNKFAASNSHHGIQDIQKKITNKVTQNGHQENKQPPKAGDKIMYKILELDDHYNPIVSDFKEAIILEYDPSNNSVDLKHTSHTDSRRRGKFEIESDEEIFSNDMEIIKVEWERLIEPQLVH